MAQSFTNRRLLRPLPTFFLVGLSVVVAASCVADNDEPLASSDSAVAAVEPASAVDAKKAVVSDAPSARLLRQTFPTHADRVLGRARTRGFVSVDRGFAREPDASLAMHLDVHLPSDGREAVRLTAPGGHEIRVRQLGVEGEGELAEHAVAYRRAGGTSFWTVTNGGAEEWLHLEEGAVTSDLDVAAEWEIEGATPVLKNGAVALMDDEGVARAWVTAPEAFGAEGRPVDLRLSVEGHRIELFADARGEEVLLDPSWVAVAPVNPGRIGGFLAALSNGKVLFGGGTSDFVTTLTTTQLYDPATNTWTAGGNMVAGRYQPVTVVLNTGNVLVAGGQDGSFYPNSAERYKPGRNTWLAAGTVSGVRKWAMATNLVTNNVLMVGGCDGTTFFTFGQLYNPTTNSWTANANMQSARGLATMVRLANGNVLVAGGLAGTLAAPTLTTPSAEVFNYTNDTWAPTGNMVTGRYGATGTLLPNGKVLITGGYGMGGALTTSELYDPATNMWTPAGSRTTPAGDQAAVLLGSGRMLVAGGNDGTNARAESEIYDPATGMWSSAGNLQSPRDTLLGVLLAGGDALVVSGNDGNDLGSPSVDRYVTASLAAGAACQFGAQCTSGFCVDNVCCTVSACTASDSCHNPGTCQAGTGVCSNPAKPNGTVCNDGNLCTQADSCQNGICTGANPVVCMASNQCHDVGTCNTGTGTCSNPPKPNGTVCSDGNACTQTDTCQAGACTGANPVECMAQDQCHDAGTCNTATGTCSNPVKADGSMCNDNNGCTQTDTCQAGACTGANPVVCTAMDQCHDVGTCDAANGMCSNPAKADGTMCNDNNACTQTDTCQAGSCTGANPVVCSASDQCHNAGTCDPASGMCSNPAKADGAPCNDANACTQLDTCVAGTCTGASPVICTAMDQCHDAGTCDSATGMCSNPAKADGVACDDGDMCTQTDSCTAGACTGGNPITCTASDQCHDMGTCDPTTGLCSDPAKADGDACDDGDMCTQTDSCQAGVCNGAMPVTCMAQDECHDAGMCDSTNGMCSNPEKADGTPCTGGTCKAGACIPDTGSSSSSSSSGAGGAGGEGGSATGGSGGGATTDDTGCGCRVAGSDDGPSSSAFAGLALAAMAMIRRRRSARS